MVVISTDLLPVTVPIGKAGGLDQHRSAPASPWERHPAPGAFACLCDSDDMGPSVGFKEHPLALSLGSHPFSPFERVGGRTIVNAASIFGPMWICVLALCAVLGDAFFPFLPSGSLVILAVLRTSQIDGAPLLLATGVAIASFLGDLLLLQLARRGAPSVRRQLTNRPRLAAGVERFQQDFVGRTTRTKAAIVVIARFVPGGRTVLDLAMGHSPEHPIRFLRWSALSALVWASYIVTLGWLDSHWFNTFWLSFAVSCAAATAISTGVARLVRRRRLALV